MTTPASVKILPRSCLVSRNPAAPTSPGTDLICPDLFIFWGEFICAILEPPFKKVPYSWQKPWMMCWSQELGSASQKGWTCIFFSCRFVRHSKHHFPSFSPYLSNNFHSPVVSFLHLGWASWSTNLAGFVVRPKLVSGNFSDEKKGWGVLKVTLWEHGKREHDEHDTNQHRYTSGKHTKSELEHHHAINGKINELSTGPFSSSQSVNVYPGFFLRL